MIKKIILAMALACLPFSALAQPRPCPSPAIGCTYKNISTNATTVVKSGPGFVHTITINTKGASANTATVYDNTAGSGTVIAVIDTTGNVGQVVLDVGFSTGLTIVTATGTAGNITVSFN